MRSLDPPSPVAFPDWRLHVRNGPRGGKERPFLVSPGGAVVFGCADPPDLPAPGLLGIDFPYLVVDNWLVRFFPPSAREMEWLAKNAPLWARQRPTPQYKRFLIAFLDRIESACVKDPNPHWATAP